MTDRYSQPPIQKKSVAKAKAEMRQLSTQDLLANVSKARDAIDRYAGLEKAKAEVSEETRLALLAECAHVLDEMQDYLRRALAHRELEPSGFGSRE
jgi:hypothetical protein